MGERRVEVVIVVGLGPGSECKVEVADEGGTSQKGLEEQLSEVLELSH